MNGRRKGQDPWGTGVLRRIPKLGMLDWMPYTNAQSRPRHRVVRGFTDFRSMRVVCFAWSRYSLPLGSRPGTKKGVVSSRCSWHDWYKLILRWLFKGATAQPQRIEKHPFPLITPFLLIHIHVYKHMRSLFLIHLNNIHADMLADDVVVDVECFRHNHAIPNSFDLNMCICFRIKVIRADSTNRQQFFQSPPIISRLPSPHLLDAREKNGN